MTAANTRPSDGSSRSGRPGAPTDLDLMLYVDGELEPERIPVVEAELERSARLRQKVAALRLAAELVSESALERASDAVDGIAGAVMARIAAGEGAAESSGAHQAAEIVPI